MTAAWLAFTSGGSRERLAKLAGRRVLPGLDLLDTAGDQPPDGSDDGGHPAGALAVVSGGVLRALPRDPDTGLLAGRMVWDHDTRGCAARFPASLRLTGPEVPLPADALELTVCVEGLQRYHADGVLRLACPARTADEPDRWFMLQLRGRAAAAAPGGPGTHRSPGRRPHRPHRHHRRPGPAGRRRADGERNGLP